PNARPQFTSCIVFRQPARRAWTGLRGRGLRNHRETVQWHQGWRFVVHASRPTRVPVPMSKLILHELAHSPFCIPVRRILEAYERPFECVAVSASDRRGLARLTGGAYYQVPVLEDGGRVVHETAEDPLAVAHYLDMEVAGGGLFPAHCAGIQEIIIAHIEDTLEGIGFRLSDPGYVDAIEDLGERVMVIRHKERKMGVG